MWEHAWMKLLSAVRPRHWVKNLLIFVAPLGAGALSLSNLYQLALGIVALSLSASAMYLVNDVRDIDTDRLHPSKRNRAISSGEISIGGALALAALLIIVSAILGWVVSFSFLLLLGIYVMAVLSYSWWLKAVPAVDIVLLALLFVLRIVSGAIATNVEVSAWLLATSFFAFLSIATGKRVVELDLMAEAVTRGAETGRGYSRSDYGVMTAAGISIGIASGVLLALYVEVGDAAQQMNRPELLWLAIPVWVYWIIRFWLLVSRGKVDNDPIEFVLRDRISYFAVVGFLILLFMAL